MSQATQTTGAAPSGGQAAAPPASPTPNPPAAATHHNDVADTAPLAASSYGVPAHLQPLFDGLRSESIARKKKLKAERQARSTLESEVATLRAELDTFKTAAEAAKKAAEAAKAQQVETALLEAIKAKGLDEAAAKLLIPAVRALASTDPKTGAVTVDGEKLSATIAPFAPATKRAASPTRAATLHTLNDQTRTAPTAPPPPLTLREQIKLRAEERQASKR